MVVPGGDENLNIPFNILGDAEETLLRIEERVRSLAQALDSLQASAKGPRDSLQRQTRTVKAQATAYQKAAQELKDYTDAETRFVLAAQELEPTRQQEIRALKAATKAIDKRIVSTQKLTRLQQVGRDSAANLASGYHAEVDALTAVNKRLADYATKLKTAQELEKRNASLLKRGERDLLARSRGQLTEGEEKAQAQKVASIRKKLQSDIESNSRRIAAKKRTDEAAERAHYRKMKGALDTAIRQNAQISELKRRQRIEQERIRKEQIKARKELSLFNRQGNRSLFIFRRLFGVLAAFTAARFGLESFFGGVKASLDFNKNIEQAKLGIASLFTAVGNVKDALGGTVNKSDQLALAQKEAARQTALLRKDALSTAATFDQLLDTFQIGLAPGIASGLNVDQIREFTVRISQAATAIGLQQNQLAEEIRSILQGTIQARTTRIAVALGITNEDIRRMKEVGKLNEFLTTKFAAFEEAGTKAMDTMAGLISRVKDAFMQLVGAAGEPFFDQAKQGLRELFDAFTEESAGGLIEPSPEAVASLQEIFQGITDAVKDARAFAKELGADSITSTAFLIGGVIRTGMKVILGIAQGLADAFRVVQRVIETIKLGEGTEDLRDWVASFTKIAALIFIANTGLNIAVGLYKKGVLLLKIINAAYLTLMFNVGRFVAFTKAALISMKGMVPLLKTIGLHALTIVGPFVAAAVAIQQILQELTGINDLGIMESLKILGASLTNFWDQFLVSIKITFSKVGDFISNVFKDPARTIVGLFTDIAETVAAVLSFAPGEIGKNAEASLQKIYKLQAKLDAQGGGGDSQRTKDLKKELTDLQKKAAENAEKETESIRNARIETEKLADTQKSAGEEALTFSKLMEELPINIGASAEALTVAEGSLKSIREEMEALALESNFSGIGLSGSAAQQQKTALQTAKRVQSELREINSSILEQEEKLLGIRARGNILGKASLELSKYDRNSVQRLVEVGSIYSQIKSEISQKEEEILLTSLELKAAEESKNRTLTDTKRAELTSLETQKKRLDIQLKTAEAAGQEATQSASPEALKFAKEGLAILGQERTIKADISAAAENTRITEGEILSLGQQRLNQLREEQLFSLGRDVSSLSNELEAMEEITRFKRGQVGADQHQLNLAKQRVAVLYSEHEEMSRQNQANVASLTQLRDETIAGSTAREQAEAVLNLEREKGTTELHLQNEEIRQAQEEVRQLGLIANGSITQGLAQGLRNFADDFRSTFQAGITIAYEATNQLAGFISDTIVDAFDPTTKTSLKERFGRFVQSISKIILDQLAKIYVAKLAIKALSFGFSAGGEVGTDGTAVGAASGGWIGRISNLSHFGPNVQGLARGGPPRPQGLHPKDVVPIWAAVGEYVMRVTAVNKYGKETMAKINAGLVDPMGLKALAGNTAPRVSRPAIGPGFQEGGVVSEVLQKKAADDLAHQTASNEGQNITRALVVSSEAEFDKLLAGGRGAMYKFFKENSADIEGILQKERI